MSLFSRIQKEITSLFLFGKTVDLILIFIGLICALQVNSYVEQRKKEETYKKILTRIHTEININRIFLLYYSNSIYRAENISKDLAGLQSTGFTESYDGLFQIHDLIVPQLVDVSFKATHKDEYLNNNLYSKIKL